MILTTGSQHRTAQLQSCRPLSGAVIWRKVKRFPPGFSALQSCRPLSGAVIGAGPVPIAFFQPLQSCRPLSGAVIRRHRRSPASPHTGFNRAAPFRERLSGTGISLRHSCWGFNRAAPFRERLYDLAVEWQQAVAELQSCRPLSGAVIAPATCPPKPAPTLQSCRPLSGAVMTTSALMLSLIDAWLQSCRPLSGAVIRSPNDDHHQPRNRFNRAAPFRERLSGNGRHRRRCRR